MLTTACIHAMRTVLVSICAGDECIEAWPCVDGSCLVIPYRMFDADTRADTEL